MAQVPVEVDPPIWVQGTPQADVLAVTEGTIAPHIGPDIVDSPLEVDAYGGNDEIIRDRTGHYTGHDGDFRVTSIDGGAGLDRLNYAVADGPILADLTPGIHVPYGVPMVGWGSVRQTPSVFEGELGWERGVDYVRNVEWLVGSNFGDEIHGSAGANRFWGHGGDDVVHGGGGDDRLYGDQGDDDLLGGGGKDLIEGADGDDFLHGGSGDDELYGGDGVDEIHGNENNDVIDGGDGGDDLRGGAGHDIIRGGDGSNEIRGDSGNDTIELGGFGDNEVWGGAGTDKVVFTQAAVVNLYNGFSWRGANGVDGEDTLGSIENVETGQHVDAVLGTEWANDIRTGAGGDWVMGLGGNDTVWGQGGDDTLLGGDGEDVLNGGTGADELLGDDGADVILGYDGGDTVAGGASADVIRLNGFGGPDDDADVLVWGVGDVGLDVVHGFALAQDRLDFKTGFLAAGPREDNLLVFDSGADALLFGKLAGDGWQAIARLKNVDSDALESAIDDGSIFVQVGVLGEGTPGGLLDVAPPGLDPSALFGSLGLDPG